MVQSSIVMGLHEMAIQSECQASTGGHFSPIVGVLLVIAPSCQGELGAPDDILAITRERRLLSQAEWLPFNKHMHVL